SSSFARSISPIASPPFSVSSCCVSAINTFTEFHKLFLISSTLSSLLPPSLIPSTISPAGNPILRLPPPPLFFTPTPSSHTFIINSAPFSPLTSTPLPANSLATFSHPFSSKILPTASPNFVSKYSPALSSRPAISLISRATPSAVTTRLKSTCPPTPAPIPNALAPSRIVLTASSTVPNLSLPLRYTISVSSISLFLTFSLCSIPCKYV
ncbi:hypothetical protein AX774_g2433, partial [Zancudomyces culisetae]